MTDPDIAAAWAEIHAATPAYWYAGRPSEHPEPQEWLIYAYDAREVPKVGMRSKEWTAMAPTELDVVREMARCLREIGDGLVPK